MNNKDNGYGQQITNNTSPFEPLLTASNQVERLHLVFDNSSSGWSVCTKDGTADIKNPTQPRQAEMNAQPSADSQIPQYNQQQYFSPAVPYYPQCPPLTSRQEEQRMYSEQREAAREARADLRREISHRSGNEIVKFNGALCMSTPSGKLAPIMDIAPDRIIYIEVDPLYQVDSYYIVIYRGFPNEIILNEEIVNGKSLGSELIKATGFQIRSKLSEAKLSSFLRNYFNKNCIRFHLAFHQGWKMDSGTPKFHLFNNSTHGIRHHIYTSGFFEEIATKTPPIRTASALYSAEKYAELMEVVISFGFRSDMSMVFHIAFLYSLLRFWGYRFPFGICFHGKNAGAIAVLKDLLCWFGDGAIPLDKREAAFLDDLLERKDQPIVIEGIRGSHPNCKALDEALRIGHVSQKNNPDGEPLQGLVCAVSQYTSDLSFAENIATVELPEIPFRRDGLSYIHDLLPHLQEYFLNLAAYITHHANRLKAEFDTNMTAFREMDFGYLSPDFESVNAAGVLYATAELVRDYHKSLAPNEKLSARLANLTDTGCAERMLERFVNARCNVDGDSGSINLFAAILQESLDNEKFDVREYCTRTPMSLPDPKTPLVLDDGQRYMLTHTAMSQVVNQTGLPANILKRALRDAGILIGTRANVTTYETRITVRTLNNKSLKIPVYKIDKERLYDPTLYM